MKSLRPIQKKLTTGLVAGLAAIALAACTSNSSDDDKADLGGGTSQAASGSNDDAGDKVVIGFSAPAADHGWMGSITQSAKDVAAQYDDVELRVAEGTNDVNLQISQVETFINDKVDAIAAVVIGGTLLSGGRGTIVGTVLGVLIFTTLNNVFILNNRSISEQELLRGVIIVAAVLLQQRLASRNSST